MIKGKIVEFGKGDVGVSGWCGYLKLINIKPPQEIGKLLSTLDKDVKFGKFIILNVKSLETIKKVIIAHMENNKGFSINVEGYSLVFPENSSASQLVVLRNVEYSLDEYARLLAV